MFDFICKYIREMIIYLNIDRKEGEKKLCPLTQQEISPMTNDGRIQWNFKKKTKRHGVFNFKNSINGLSI